MSSASFNSILALFCRIFKYKFGMVNKLISNLSCAIWNRVMCKALHNKSLVGLYQFYFTPLVDRKQI